MKFIYNELWLMNDWLHGLIFAYKWKCYNIFHLYSVTVSETDTKKWQQVELEKEQKENHNNVIVKESSIERRIWRAF